MVNGALQRLRADARLVPTDSGFHVLPSWHEITGPHPEKLQPRRWDTDRFGEAVGMPGVWFLDVARADLTELTGDLGRVLRSMAASVTGPPLASARSRPLIAIPSVGGRAGGFNNRRGELITAILTALRDVTRLTGVDIVVVARDLATFSAYQASRRTRARKSEEAFGQDGSWQRKLGKRIRDGEVALFFGAGVSISAGLPSWPGLINKLDQVAGGGKVEPSELPSPLDQAQLLANRLEGRFGSAVVEVLKHANRDGSVGLSHALLAGYRCREAVTTNFDDLYERAVEDADGDPPDSVPTDQNGRQPWLLKLHGDIDDPASIVLSREQFVAYAGSSTARGAVLQSLMLTRHLLVVGASFSDDNLLRLLFEVKQLRQSSNDHPIGTVLTLTPDAAREEMLGDDFSFRPVTQQHDDDEVASRALEIELDRIGMYACVNASYLASPDFTGMLNDDEQAVAQQLRELAGAIDRLDRGERLVDGWRLVREALTSFGAPRPRV